MSEKEKTYRELEQEYKASVLKLRAYKHRLERFLDPGSDEWDAECQAALDLERKCEALLPKFGIARLDYMNEHRCALSDSCLLS